MHLQQLLIRYGLIAVLVGSALEGDFTLLFAGVVARLGIFAFPLAVARQLGPWQLVAARFVYGTKSASMIFWGLHGLSFRRFLLIDSVGCVLGSLVFTSLGYLLSGSAMALLGHVKRVELWLLGGAIVGVLVVMLIDRTAKHELHIDHVDKKD